MDCSMARACTDRQNCSLGAAEVDCYSPDLVPNVPTASFPLQKAAFQDANVCLFVFDCIYFNDVSLMDR